MPVKFHNRLVFNQQYRLRAGVDCRDLASLKAISSLAVCAIDILRLLDFRDQVDDSVTSSCCRQRDVIESYNGKHQHPREIYGCAQKLTTSSDKIRKFGRRLKGLQITVNIRLGDYVTARCFATNRRRAIINRDIYVDFSASLSVVDSTSGNSLARSLSRSFESEAGYRK